MEFVYLGGTGLRVSRLCLGTMTFGEIVAAKAQCSADESHKILDAFVATGANFIDTADIYQQGESERILGSWLAKNPHLRSKLVIATKARNPVNGATAGPNDQGLSRSHIFASIDASLARLQTTFIDLYQMHVWDDGTPVEETLRALDDLVKAGKIRYYGWSNTTGWQLQKLVETARRLNLSPVVSLQQQYSLLCRQIEWELVDVCEGERVALLPWSPLKGGWLSGKMRRDKGVPEGSRIAWATEVGSKMQSAVPFDTLNDERIWLLIDELELIAKAHADKGATVAQCAIRWLLQKRVVTSVVIGAKSVAQLMDNMGALTFSLTDAEMAKLDALSAAVMGPVPYPYEMVARINNPRKRPFGK